MNWAYLKSVIVIMASLIAFLTIVIMAGAWMLARFSRRAREQRLEDILSRVGKNLLAIPVEEARRLALDRLSMSPDFEIEQAETPLTFTTMDLGPELFELMNKYSEIHYQPDNSFIARSALAPHPENPAWLRIGRDGEHDWLLLRAGHDEIAVWNEEAEEADQRMAEQYPSIHHWLISLMPYRTNNPT